ncbi:MAG TPA: DNA gyrase C-terminal beta-propeller domain-containing protein, partial [Woeseiaceae bacterium]|nr:DNA gyrase C-terminal beta-propeller domain-containing protein [Woeseiaceae bacterium]
PAEAKEALVARRWMPGSVSEMLDRAAAVDTRPDHLEDGFGLVDGEYRLSPVQAQAILDLRLHRLTGLEQDKILNEYKEILDRINALSLVLSDPDELLRVIREELVSIREEYGDARRTEIVQDHSDLLAEDLIPEEEVVVTLSHGGYAKAQPIDDYQAQRRGGRGRSAAKVKDEDFIDKLFIANTHDTLLCFSSSGKMYWLKVYQVPQASRGSRGKPIVNLLPLSEGERISAVLPIREFTADSFVLMATSGGTVKKTPLSQFSRPRSSGIIAIDLRHDRLVDVAITDGRQEILLVASNGKAIRFSETDVRPMGRGAAGVRGIKLTKGHEVIALSIIGDGLILSATENGYGKRTAVDEFPTQGRGGQGVIAIQTTDRNGRTVGALQVYDDDEIMLISSSGTLVRTPVRDISIIGRNTQGVRLIRLESGQRLVGLARIEPLAEEADESD